jgi:hypothetical protein
VHKVMVEITRSRDGKIILKFKALYCSSKNKVLNSCVQQQSSFMKFTVSKKSREKKLLFQNHRKKTFCGFTVKTLCTFFCLQWMILFSKKGGTTGTRINFFSHHCSNVSRCISWKGEKSFHWSIKMYAMCVAHWHAHTA